MSPEKFHDALNYLDDDLIAQTDDLRQGRRVLHRKPKVIHWLVPAACLVLVLGIGSGLLPVWETGSGVPMENDAEYGQQLPGEMFQDFLPNTSSDASRQESASQSWKSVSLDEISLSIPEDWEHELAKADDGSYFIIVRPAGTVGAMKIGYSPNFGVCGTGLTVKQTTIAGMDANAGYYDDGMHWSFITFQAGDKQYVVLKDGTDA